MSKKFHSLQSDEAGETRAGFLYTLSAFLIWGLMPLFMKAIAHIGTLEVLAYRIIWSIPVALLVLLATGRTSDMIRIFNSPRKLATISISAIFISLNWGVYVWAIAADRTIEAALGYYINPLISIALGMVLLGEKMDRLQMFALGLAVLAVLILTFNSGQIPWVALILACSFAIYGFMRKTVDIGPTQGFMMEVLILSVIAIPYVMYLGYTNSTHMGVSTIDTLLILGCGPITAVPLILFAYGAKRLRLSTVGIMQYVAPTMIFLIGVFVFHEPFNRLQLFAFVLIWLAIAIYTWSGLRKITPRQADPV